MDKWEKIDQYGYILTKYNTIVTELIYFWTLSENRLNVVPGKKKQIQSYATRAKNG